MSRFFLFGLGLGLGAGIALFLPPQSREKGRQQLIGASVLCLDYLEDYVGRVQRAVEEGKRAAEEMESELKGQISRESEPLEAPKFIV